MDFDLIVSIVFHNHLHIHVDFWITLCSFVKISCKKAKL